MRSGFIITACLSAALMLAAPTAGAQSAFATVTAEAPPIGGLSLAPPEWRYQPPAPALTTTNAGDWTEPPSALQRRATVPLALDTAYVADRASFVNTVRARRGLSLLTLWEGAGRCLFFGINERGRAGLNFVPLRQLGKRQAARNEILALYDTLTGAPRDTWVAPPRLFPH